MKALLKNDAKCSNKSLSILENANGKVMVPLLLWFMGVPGIVVIFLWLFFFRG